MTGITLPSNWRIVSYHSHELKRLNRNKLRRLATADLKKRQPSWTENSGLGLTISQDSRLECALKPVWLEL